MPPSKLLYLVDAAEAAEWCLSHRMVVAGIYQLDVDGGILAITRWPEHHDPTVSQIHANAHTGDTLVLSLQAPPIARVARCVPARCASLVQPTP